MKRATGPFFKVCSTKEKVIQVGINDAIISIAASRKLLLYLVMKDCLVNLCATVPMKRLLMALKRDSDKYLDICL